MNLIAPQADLQTLGAVIAHSPIIVAAKSAPILHLPSGFDETDIAILEWIAGEARRAAHGYVGCM